MNEEKREDEKIGPQDREDGGDGADLSFPIPLLREIKWATVGYTRTSVVELGWHRGGVKGQRYEISWLESFLPFGQEGPNPCLSHRTRTLCIPPGARTGRD